MRRAIRLAMNGRGRAEPNPMVGCVIVKDGPSTSLGPGRLIGQGYHQQYGGPHAEPTALAASTESPAGATIYTTLEPCCHTSKQTPPCVPRLIEAKVARVVIGSIDPDPRVDGRGAAQLRAAGIEVPAPVLEESCRQLLAPFIARVVHRRPYVTLKWAQSRNDKVAGAMGRRVRITGDASDRIVHALRARCDAIAVGTNTVLNDDPLLTARPAEGRSRQPLRVVLSNSLKLPPQSRLVRSAREHPVVIYCSASSAAANTDVVAGLRSAGVEVVGLPDHDGRFSFADVLTDLHARGTTHLLVEPGPTLTRYFLSRGQADRVWVFRSRHTIDESGGLAISSAPVVDYPPTDELGVDSNDTLTEYLNPDSAVYFAAEPSADFVLAAEAARGTT
jgi:diaminohydroxyphosphoribosylaminopyrimidine deaminase/5-amino-6-(5-phosphoribosylamino)uracil reductase